MPPRRFVGVSARRLPAPLPSGSRDRRAASQKSLKWPGDLPNRARERRHIPPTVLGAAARPAAAGTMTAEDQDSAALPEEGLPAEVTPCPFVGHRGKRVPYAAQSHVGRQDGRLQDPAQTGRGTQTPGGRARPRPRLASVCPSPSRLCCWPPPLSPAVPSECGGRSPTPEAFQRSPVAWHHPPPKSCQHLELVMPPECMTLTW